MTNIYVLAKPDKQLIFSLCSSHIKNIQEFKNDKSPCHRSIIQQVRTYYRAKFCFFLSSDNHISPYPHCQETSVWLCLTQTIFHHNSFWMLLIILMLTTNTSELSVSVCVRMGKEKLQDVNGLF